MSHRPTSSPALLVPIGGGGAAAAADAAARRAAGQARGGNPVAEAVTADDHLSPRLVRSRQKAVLAACEQCRRRRVKCSGTRPRCVACEGSQSECVYRAKANESPAQALKRKYSDLQKGYETYEKAYRSLASLPRHKALDLLDTIRTQVEPDVALKLYRSIEGHKGHHGEDSTAEVMDHLGSAPDHVVRVALERLRTSVTPREALAAIHGDPVMYRPSEREAALCMLPPFHSLLELELMAKHPAMYPKLDPRLDAGLSVGPRIWQAQMGVSSAGVEMPVAGATLTNMSNKESPGSESVPRDEVLPAPPPEYYDSRLNHLNIAFWTTVPVTNHIAAQTISLYLQTDHPVLAPFDSQTFIGSLVEGKLDFCSTLLVNALLAFASLGYTSTDPDASSRGLAFEKEAETLWRAERGNVSNSTLSALVLLYLSVVFRGNPQRGFKYIQEATTMAAELRLFGVEDTVTVKEWKELTEAEQASTAYAAWGAFNMITLQAIFSIPLATEFSPTIPIPGDTEGVTLSSHPSMGHTFATMCRFYVVVSRILVVYHPKSGPRPASPAFALTAYGKLLALSDQLTASMVRSSCYLPHVLVFHMYLHGIVLDIFRPFVMLENQKSLPSGLFGTDRSPRDIYRASLKQLRRLVLVYRLFPESSRSVFWHTALMYIANAALDDSAGDPDWRFYFLVAVQGYQRLGKCYRLAPALGQGLVTMAADGGAIGVGEMRTIASRLLRPSLHPCTSWSSPSQSPPSRPRLEQGKLGIRVNLNLPVTDSDKSQLDKSQLDYLLDRFDDLGLFGEFTDGLL